MFSQLFIGYSALRAANAGLDVVAQNIANAGDPNYHRQRITFAPTQPAFRDGQWYGTGVNAVSVSRIRSESLSASITRNLSAQAGTLTQLETGNYVETLFTPSVGSITGRLDQLFVSLEALSANPEDFTNRQDFVQITSNLTQEFNRVARELDQRQASLVQELRRQLTEVDKLSRKIVDLNDRIEVAESQGGTPNGLYDQRDALINELSVFVDVEVNQPENTVLAAQGAIILGPSDTQEISLKFTSDLRLQLVREVSETEVNPATGTIAGLLQAYNQVQYYQSQLDDLSQALIQTLDPHHTTGVGTAGAFESLFAQRGVRDVSVPLADAELPIPTEAGQIFVGINDVTSGERTLHRVDFDPATESLDDLATKLSSIDHFQAVVNADTGRVTLFAEHGYTFDFTGEVSTYASDGSGITGTALPTFAGAYTGDANEEFSFEVVGTGEVGVTPGLELRVVNSVGDLVTTLNIGEGYAPGDELELPGGLSLQVPTGTLNAGDTFSTYAVSDGDTTGALAALGINTLFVGDSARNLAIHPDLLADPGRLASSRTGEEGDASALLRMLQARESQVAVGGTQSAENFAIELVSQTGSDVLRFQFEYENTVIVGQRLNLERESLSGVDPDEEIVHMLNYQRSFEAAARYVSVISETTAELLRIVG